MASITPLNGRMKSAVSKAVSETWPLAPPPPLITGDDRGMTVVLAGGAVVSVCQLADELGEQLAVHSQWLDAVAAEELAELLQVRAVGLKRVARQSVLEPQAVGELVEQAVGQCAHAAHSSNRQRGSKSAEAARGRL